MINLIYRFLFFIISIYFLIKVIYYAVYEINKEKNKNGGITLIVFSSIVVILSNIVVLIK